ISTFTRLAGDTHDPAGAWIVRHVGAIVVALMTVFTISFGARRLDPTERHPGLVTALAVECVVKLFAFLALGVFVTFFLFHGTGDLFTRLSESPFRHMLDTGRGDLGSVYLFATYMVLGMSAIQFLPRQFHIAVVENSDEAHLRTTTWLFPLYL